MQFLILVCLSFVALASGQWYPGLDLYTNGAITPHDENLHKANLAHYKAIAEAGGPAAPVAAVHAPFAYAGYPFAYAGYPGYFGYPYAGFPYAYAGHHVYAIPYVHPPASGAIVPPEPVEVVEARAAHLKAHAE